MEPIGGRGRKESPRLLRVEGVNFLPAHLGFLDRPGGIVDHQAHLHGIIQSCR